MFNFISATTTRTGYVSKYVTLMKIQTILAYQQQYSTVQYCISLSAKWYSTVLHGTALYSMVNYNTVCYSTVLYGTVDNSITIYT